VKLRYIGPTPGPNSAIPLPEGWPAYDHDEPDPVLAEAKLALRMHLPGEEKGKPTGGPLYAAAVPGFDPEPTPDPMED
jgi:hypothetical protein